MKTKETTPLQLLEAHETMCLQMWMHNNLGVPNRLNANRAMHEYFAELERFRAKYGERCKGGEQYDNRRTKR